MWYLKRIIYHTTVTTLVKKKKINYLTKDIFFIQNVKFKI